MKDDDADEVRSVNPHRRNKAVNPRATPGAPLTNIEEALDKLEVGKNTIPGSVFMTTDEPHTYYYVKGKKEATQSLLSIIETERTKAYDKTLELVKKPRDIFLLESDFEFPNILDDPMKDKVVANWNALRKMIIADINELKAGDVGMQSPPTSEELKNRSDTK